MRRVFFYFKIFTLFFFFSLFTLGFNFLSSFLLVIFFLLVFIFKFEHIFNLKNTNNSLHYLLFYFFTFFAFSKINDKMENSKKKRMIYFIQRSHSQDFCLFFLVGFVNFPEGTALLLNELWPTN